MKFQARLTTAIATGAILFSAVSPAFAATTLTVTGNGASSENTVTVGQTNTTTVVQNNNANIQNNVSAKAETGDNTASRNTGGNVSVSTGDATSKTAVTNNVNTNVAQTACCANGSTEVTVAGNGDKSENAVGLEQSNTTQVWQNNNANIENNVSAKAETGENKANSNTGGNVTVKSGDATAHSTVENKGNSNAAMVGGTGHTGAGALTVKIMGNGIESDNSIELGVEKSTIISQANNGHVENNVSAKAETGENKADRNTGGNVSVETGDATAKAGVHNMMDFNVADVDCGGCIVGDVTAKIAENGDKSENEISAELGGGVAAFQGNCAYQKGPMPTDVSFGDEHGHKCGTENNVSAKGETGENNVKSNTAGGAGYNDPAVTTGDAYSETNATNDGNVNVYGPNAEFPMPTFDFNFNMTGFWAWFVGHSA